MAQTASDVHDCLQRGDSIEHRDFKGRTPFIHHCKCNNIEVVRTLLKYECDVTAVYKEKNGLMFACGNGHSELLRLLLQQKSILALIDTAITFTTPLIAAIEHGHTDIFDILIEFGANPNVPVEYGHSPLMEACFGDDMIIIDRLLALRVNVNAINSDGSTALFFVDSVAAMIRLYTHGVDLNVRDKDGCTALMRFIRGHKDVELVQCLIDYGADVNVRDNNGKSTLLYAWDTINKWDGGVYFERIMAANVDTSDFPHFIKNV